jgi:hypothetical protein
MGARNVARGQYNRRQPVTDRDAVGIHGRELGRRLRAAQRAAGLDGIALARALGVTETKVSRMMNGVIHVGVADAAALLAFCGVVGEERDQILDLCHPRHDAGILRLSDGTQSDAYLYHGRDAVRLIEYQPLVIPWLAQTESYREACWSSPDRQMWVGKLDHDGAAALWADKDWVELLVHEWALRTLIGARALWPAQVHGLLHLSTVMRMSVRVIPAHQLLPVTASSGFTLLEFARKRSLVFREDLTGGVFCDAAEQVETHRAIVAQLRGIALNRHRSRELLEQIASEPAPAADQLEQLQE